MNLETVRVKIEILNFIVDHSLYNLLDTQFYLLLNEVIQDVFSCSSIDKEE